MTRTEINAIAKEVVRLLTQQKEKEEDIFLDTAEAAAYLKISKQTLYNNSTNIPRVKNGRKVLYSKNALQRFVQNGGLTNK